MIGFIKNLISGILDFFIGLLGGKKSQEKLSDSKPAELPGKVTGKTKRRSGFYLELDEANSDTKSVEAKQPAPANGAKAPEPAAAAKSEPAKTPEPAAAAKSEPAKTPEAAAAQPVKVELVQTAKGVKAEPAKPAKATPATASQTPTETTFAPKYLSPSSATSNGRRRPGPSMNPFLDMARQVKTPG